MKYIFIIVAVMLGVLVNAFAENGEQPTNGVQTSVVLIERPGINYTPLRSNPLTVTDNDTGAFATATPNDEIIWKDNAGKIIWATNVTTFVGASPISSMRIDGTNLVIRAFRNYVILDKANGKVETYVRTGPDKLGQKE